MGFYQGELDLAEAITGLERMPKQKAFVTSQHFATAYVGGEGAGKSVALCVTCILNSLADAHGLSLVGRLNMPALETTTMRTFLELVPAGEGEWAEAKKTWTFHNGHEVIFRHLDISDPKVTGHIRSLNLSAAYVDEASEIPEEVFFMLIGRLRRKTAFRRIYRSSSNPAGHDYQWRHFFDPERDPKIKSTNLGIGASSMDNVFLPAEYHERRKLLYPADWYERFVMGSFADFSDLVFKEFSDRSHIWDETKHWEVFGNGRNPPDDWPIIIGMDIGGGEEGDPWAIPVIAVAPDGRLYQYAEVYGSGLRIKPIADELQSLMGKHPLDGLAYDYAQRAAAMELDEYGIGGQPAIKEVRPGLFKTEQYVHIDPSLVHPFNPNIEGSPRFFVSSACKETIREMGAYKWAKDRAGRPKVPAEPAHENSHSPSAIRYAIHTFRPNPIEIAPAKKWEKPGLPIMSRIYWQKKEENDAKQERMKRISFLSHRPALHSPRRPM
jgi:hypothetical protein